MKILFAGHNSLLGTFVDELGKQCDLTVLYSNRGVDPGWINVKIIVVNYAALGTRFVEKWLRLELSAPSYINNLRLIVDREKPDAIVVFDFFRLYFWQFLWLLRKQRETKFYLYSETKYLPQNFLAKILFRFFIVLLKINRDRIDKIFVFTNEGKNFFNTYVPHVRVEIMPVPVNTNRFYTNPEKVFMKDNVLRIIMNARFVGYKNHKNLFDALKIAGEKGLKFELTLIGRGGYLKNELLNYAKELGIHEQIRHIASVPNEKMRDIYVEHDVLILPSYKEAVGMVVPEAMACGIPTITSDTVGANVYVKEGETGLVFKTGDVKELGLTISKIADAQLLKKMSISARENIELFFTTEKYTSRFRKYL